MTNLSRFCYLQVFFFSFSHSRSKFRLSEFFIGTQSFHSFSFFLSFAFYFCAILEFSHLGMSNSLGGGLPSSSRPTEFSGWLYLAKLTVVGPTLCLLLNDNDSRVRRGFKPGREGALFRFSLNACSNGKRFAAS